MFGSSSVDPRRRKRRWRTSAARKESFRPTATGRSFVRRSSSAAVVVPLLLSLLLGLLRVGSASAETPASRDDLNRLRGRQRRRNLVADGKKDPGVGKCKNPRNGCDDDSAGAPSSCCDGYVCISGSCVSSSGATTSPSMSFYAVGGVLRSGLEACLLPHELDKLTSEAARGEGGRFLVQLGDAMDGGPPLDDIEIDDCDEATYEFIADAFASSPIPTFFVPGNNGWTDCSDPDEAWGFYEKHLLRFNKRGAGLSLPGLSANLTRSENRAELFSFVSERVLFLGQNLPGGVGNVAATEDRQRLLEDNLSWTRYSFDQRGSDIKAVVIFGHSSSSANAYYFRELIGIANDHGALPILFLEDGRAWEVDERFLAGAPNVLRIVLDDTVTPVKFTISPPATPGTATALDEVFRFDRGCPCTTNHRPTTIVSECQNSCEMSQCQGADPCGWVPDADGGGECRRE